MTFPAHDSAGMAAWSHFRELVASGMSASLERPKTARASSSAAMGAISGVRIWRVLASNNREVARSAAAYETFGEARTDVLRLQQLDEPFEVLTFHGPTSGTHGWVALSSGQVIFTCARWYETATISLEVSALSIATFRAAVVAKESGIGSAPGRRASVATR